MPPFSLLGVSMKLYLLFSVVSFLIWSHAFASEVKAKPIVVQSYARANRPPLTSNTKALYPFTFLSRNGGRYTFYEPASSFKIYDNGNVSYVRLDELGELAATGTMGAEDMLVRLPIKKLGGLRRGQRVCITRDTVYLKTGDSLVIQDFYEDNYVTVYEPGLFRALDSRSFAVQLSAIGRCR